MKLTTTLIFGWKKAMEKKKLKRQKGRLRLTDNENTGKGNKKGKISNGDLKNIGSDANGRAAGKRKILIEYWERDRMIIFRNNWRRRKEKSKEDSIQKWADWLFKKDADIIGKESEEIKPASRLTVAT